jgi:hypothetical protein
VPTRCMTARSIRAIPSIEYLRGPAEVPHTYPSYGRALLARGVDRRALHSERSARCARLRSIRARGPRSARARALRREFRIVQSCRAVPARRYARDG